MIELGSSLTYCTTPHPSWRPGAEWSREVGWVLYRHAKTLVLIDPLPTDDTWSRVGAEVAQADEPVAVLLTAPWHLRGTAEVAARFHARVWATERAWERLPVLERLERPPAGISPVAPRGVDEGQVAFFLESERALVSGSSSSGRRTASG